MHKKHQKHQKAQKRNQAKAQNANQRTEIKNALKKHEWKKVTDSLICVFVLAKKKKRKVSTIEMLVPLNQSKYYTNKN